LRNEFVEILDGRILEDRSVGGPAAISQRLSARGIGGSGGDSRHLVASPPSQNSMGNLCRCGCGRPTTNEWVRGHNKRDGRPEPYRVDPETGCWVWQRATNIHGYGKLTRGGKTWAAHRWYYNEIVPGGVPKGDLHHRCKNILCVNPEHLEPLTRAEHSHAKEDGRRKLTWEMVREIRSLRGTNQRVLAVRFGVSRPTISLIMTNRYWHDPAYEP